MMRTRAFWKGYIIYTCIIYAVVLLLVFAMGASFVNVGRDGSGLIRVSSFLVRNVFGFPINLFLVKDLGGLGVFIISIIALPLNCFIQYSFIYFLKRELTRMRSE
ncbi:MAG TPA: hypothetical protein VHM26_07145 [Chitinophagaceae bacterium]|nr:hypothetical protein [Chitinophagaceae bacterium]